MRKISKRKGYVKTQITENQDGTYTETVTAFEPITGQEATTTKVYQPTEKDKEAFEFAHKFRKLVV